MKLRITPISKRAYEVVGKNGVKYSGYVYEGFAEGGKAYSFSSQVSDHPIFEDAGEFDPNRAIMVDIRAKIDIAGKVKYREDTGSAE